MRRLILIFSFLPLMAVGQNFRLHAEQYFDHAPALFGDRVKDRTRWYSADWLPIDKVKVVGGFFEMETQHRQVIDDTYLQLGDSNINVSYGRFRPAFGINSWTDLWYSGLNQLPMFRKMLPMPSLHRSATGAQVSGSKGPFQLTVASFDRSSEDWQLAPVSVDDWVTRVQYYTPGLVLGLNNYQGNNGSSVINLGGVDAIWTRKNWQVRGEYFGGKISGGRNTMYNFETFYHPTMLPHTTFVGRAEGLQTGGGTTWGQAYRLGIKQNLASFAAVYINYGFSNDNALAYIANGWDLQVVLFGIGP